MTSETPRPRRILFVCIQNSFRSQVAEAFARMLAGRNVDAYSAGSKPSGRASQGHRQHEGAEIVAKAHGLTLTGHVLPGHEVETIVTFAKDHDIDLLVIGFMGHSKVFGRIWGSTSQNVTKLSPCSMLVVK